MFDRDFLRSRRASEVIATAQEVGALIEAGRSLPLRMEKGLAVERADELVAEVVAGRGGPLRGERQI